MSHPIRTWGPSACAALLTVALPLTDCFAQDHAGTDAASFQPANETKVYTYTSVPNDPMGTRIYTLDNGLQVWLSRNTDAPRVQTNIATRAGSKNDPADATGLAHYLEHMLFKGTSGFGTSDWGKEEPLLQAISEQYEQRRATTDEAERARIYHVIDSLSTLAAAIAIPNEYDKMVKSIGARGTNAYTSTERTVYVNDVPSDELEKWMRIEGQRFQECVLRLFHTELETVYEEFNRGQDNDYRSAYKAMNEALYKRHPYGTQTTIGLGEHLKNPSMVKIQEYFRTYYVPNNMAVVLAGDIDYDRTIAMVDRYFGSWKPGSLPPFTFKGEDPITSPIVTEVFGPMAEWVDLGWRFDGARSDDPIMLDLIAGILSNGQAGLIDLDLIQEQKVLDASANSDAQMDYSELTMHAEPKEGQTLEAARDLLLAELDRVKRGAFEDWLIPAVVNDKKQQRIRFWNENNNARAAAMTEAFILRKDWASEVDYLDRMSRITKEQVMAFASKHFGTNYACVFKRTGENKDAYKVTKPPITPIDINRKGMSAWRAEWEKIPSAPMTPEFVDYSTAIQNSTLDHGVPLACVKNTSNALFNLYYILDMGTNNDKALDLSLDLLEYLGTSTRSAADLKKEFFKLGLRSGVNASEDRVYVTLSGLDENMEKGLVLFEELLADAQPDPARLKELINDIGKERQDRMKDKGVILGSALYARARYGAKSPFNDVLSQEEMNAIPAAELVDRIHGLTAHAHKVFYYGQREPERVTRVLNELHRTPAVMEPYPPAREYTEQATTANAVFFVDHDMVQTEMLMVSKAGAFNKDNLPFASLFNEYFGSGLSSIVFQEIREAKALAYGANAAFTTPARKDEAHYVRAFIGTQADKLADATAAMLALMNDMPQDEAQFEGAKAAALKRIASERITKERIYWNWDALQRRGLDTDIRKESYERIPAITMAQMKAFFDKEVKGRPYTFLVVGKESAMDMKVLEKLGPVNKLSKREIFGYDQQP